MARPLLFLMVLAALLAAGCGSESPVDARTPTHSELTPNAPSAFDPSTCGKLTGLLSWVGPIPEVTPITYMSPAREGAGYSTHTLRAPNAPRIDRSTRGLAGAVVFLRGIDPSKAKPWDLPPVTVELNDLQITVRQGNRTERSGLVRRGDAVTFLSLEPEFNVLRGRGAAFFALPFPEPNQPLTRTLDTCGRVDLTSAAGFYWQSAELFVCDHPYYAVSDAEGRFEFTEVPAGQYDLVAWHPNWLVTRTERNPESGLTSRQLYAPPLEIARPVTITPGRTKLANLTMPK